MTRIDLIMLSSGLLLLVLGIACAMLATRRENRMLAIADTPTSPAADIAAIHRTQGAYGQRCEISGVIEAEYSLNSPLSSQACVAYSLTSAWEEWGRLQLGDYRKRADMNGQVCRDSGTNFDDQCVARFWVRDGSGRILIDPLNAELDLPQTDRRYEVMTASFGDTERRTWHTERALPVGQQVYVLGYLGDANGTPTIQRHPNQPAQKFLISHRTEQQLIGANRWASYGYYFAAGISGSLGLLLVAWRVLLLRGVL